MDDKRIAPATTVAAYMRLAQAAIGRALVAEGLYVHHAAAWQGPHTLTFAIRLYEPTSTRLKKALDLAQAVEANIQAAPVRIYSDAGTLIVEIPSPWPQTVDGTTLRGRGLAVPLGLTSRQAVIGVDLNTHAHLLAVGPTECGKTTALRGVAYHLAAQNRPADLALIAIAFDPGDWQACGRLAHCWDVITEPADAVAALRWLRETMTARTQRSQRRPALGVFVDDLANLLGLDPDLGTTVLPDLVSMGRHAGLHLILGTQRLGARGAGDALVTANIHTRLVFGTASAQDAALYTGRGGTGAHQIGAHKGDALLVMDGGVHRLAVGLITDAHLATLPQSSRTLQPWRVSSAKPTGQPKVDPGWHGAATATAPAPAPPVLAAETEKHPPPAGGAGGAGGADVGAVQIAIPDGLLRRQPTAEDVAALRALYKRLGSREAVYTHIKIKKNSLRARWLREALGL